MPVKVMPFVPGGGAGGNRNRLSAAARGSAEVAPGCRAVAPLTPCDDLLSDRTYRRAGIH